MLRFRVSSFMAFSGPVRPVVWPKTWVDVRRRLACRETRANLRRALHERNDPHLLVHARPGGRQRRGLRPRAIGILVAMNAAAERPILSWHAHVYFDPASTRPQAEGVRAGIAQRFRVQLGRWHEVPIGPHTAAMYQVAFDVDVFADLVQWLALHREGLSVLVHPNTLAPRADHLEHALWLGAPLPLRPEVLPESIAASEESPIVANTRPD